MIHCDYEVAIVGAGPAGLSAAIYLGRCRRRVVVFDHAKPRNVAAHAVNGYLGHDGISPRRLRDLGRQEASRYGIAFIDAEVRKVECMPVEQDGRSCFEISAVGFKPLSAQKLLLATGVSDALPRIANIEDFYGTSVHHCPYCDGWEHRDQRLVALGDRVSAVKLARELKTWSPHVTACTNGDICDDSDRLSLNAFDISLRTEPIKELVGTGAVLRELIFTSGPLLPCDAIFFHSHQAQQSPLAAMIGCRVDDKSHVSTYKKQFTGVNGVYLAGDAGGEVQFAIVAAAEGAIAATAINRDLQQGR